MNDMDKYMNVEDKRIKNIKKAMRFFEAVCWVLTLSFGSLTLSAHLALTLLGIEATEELNVCLIATLIVVCIAWLLYCVAFPIMDWCKERNRKKKINNYEKE